MPQLSNLWFVPFALLVLGWVAMLDRRLRGLERRVGGPVVAPSKERLEVVARDPGRKIEAIKLYRERTGVGLAEAKAAVEAMARGEAPRAWATGGAATGFDGSDDLG